MKRTLAIILMTIISIATVYAVQGMVFEYVRANTNGSSITVEWKSVTETSAVRFEIERRSGNQQFRWIANSNPKGAGSVYKYTDESAIMKSTSEKISNEVLSQAEYYYRVKIVKSDKTYEYSDEAKAIADVSGIKRTWGMIKEMFR